MAWIEVRRLVDLGVDAKIVDWLGCPTRPKVVLHTDEPSRIEERRRVRNALADRRISYTYLQAVGPAKHLLNLSVSTLDQRQLSSLLAVLARGWDTHYRIHARKEVHYFYYSDKHEIIDEPWWAEVKNARIETDGLHGDVPLVDCRLAIADEVRALRPFIAQPRLAGLGKEERDRVLDWLGRELRLAIQLKRLTLDDWDKLLGDGVPALWVRHANEPLTGTRIREAYRLYLKWRALPGNAESDSLRRALVLCEGPAGAEIIDARRQAVYLDDDADLRSARGRRVYVVEFPERVREAAVSAFNLSRLSREAQGRTLVELGPEADVFAKTLAGRLETSRPFLLALMQHRHDDADDFDQQRGAVQKLDLKFVKRIEFTASLWGPEGQFAVVFTRPFAVERHVCWVAVEDLNELDIVWNAARAVARSCDLRDLHWVLREFLQSDDADQRRALLKQLGVSTTELEDCMAGLTFKRRATIHSNCTTGKTELYARAVPFRNATYRCTRRSEVKRAYGSADERNA